MNLVVGATGVLGTEICRLLTERGKRVRALVRKTSSEEKKENLRKIGVELSEGDLNDRASLDSACRGIHSILSTATSIVSRQPGDDLIKTDRDGHLNLIDAAEKSGVKQFVFISFPPSPFEFELQNAKREVEQRLQQGTLQSTVLQPTLFQEVWLGPHLGFDAMNGRVRVYGSGTNRISWISFRDVAQFAVMSTEKQDTGNRTIPLGGPEALSPLEVVRIFEEASGRSFIVEHVPEEALKAQYESASDPISRTFAGLMLTYARGGAIDMKDVLQTMPVNLRSVRDYALAVLKSA